MGLFSAVTSPQDSRWQSTQHGYITTFLIKNTILIPFIILIIAEGVLYQRWRKEGLGATVDEKYGPYNFWLRIGIYLIPDIAFTIAMFGLIPTDCWHPITGLVVSILCFALWVVGCFINVLVVYSNEIAFDKVDSWYQLAYAEAALQALIAIMYVAMMIYASIAVHRWRKRAPASPDAGAEERVLKMASGEVECGLS